MKLGRLNHVGVATPDIEAAIAFWRDVMGATAITEPFDMPAQGVRVCFDDTPAGGTQIELLAPPDIHAAHAWFASQHKRILGEIRIGAHGTPVFFVHPRDMNGTLTEIMEAPTNG